MNLVTLTKTAVLIQTACALTIATTAIYCSHKQRQLNTTIAEGERKLADDWSTLHQAKANMIAAHS